MNLAPEREQAERFRTVIATRMGLHFDDAKLEDLGELLQRRSAQRGVRGSAYLEELAGGGGAEFGWLAAQLTVGETYFFRDANQFRALVEAALPERVRQRAGRRRLRLLSAGCASGEEPFSLAMTVRDHFPETAGWDLGLRALDVNPAALEKAARGRYTAWSLRDTPPAARERHFRREGSEFVLDPAIRSMVDFHAATLGEEDAAWGNEDYDIVFCRNVIMYLVPERMQAVVRQLTRALTPGGFLFLGHAETLRGLSHDFHLRHTHDTFYYQKRCEPGPPTAAWFDVFPSPAPAAWTPEPLDTSWVEMIQAAADRIQQLAERPGRAPAEPAVRPACQVAAALDLLRREKYRDALAALPVEPGDADTQLLRAVLQVNCGAVAEAELLCRALLAGDDLNAGAHYVLALCREHAGDHEGAREQDRLAVHLDPEFAIPHLHLGLQARRAGDQGAARRELAQAVALLRREDAARILLFGGGFSREALLAFAQAQLAASGGAA